MCWLQRKLYFNTNEQGLKHLQARRQPRLLPLWAAGCRVCGQGIQVFMRCSNYSHRTSTALRLVLSCSGKCNLHLRAVAAPHFHRIKSTQTTLVGQCLS